MAIKIVFSLKSLFCSDIFATYNWFAFCYMEKRFWLFGWASAVLGIANSSDTWRLLVFLRADNTNHELLVVVTVVQSLQRSRSACSVQENNIAAYGRQGCQRRQMRSFIRSWCKVRQLHSIFLFSSWEDEKQIRWAPVPYADIYYLYEEKTEDKRELSCNFIRYLFWKKYI